MERRQLVSADSNSPALPGVALPLQEDLFPQVSGVHGEQGEPATPLQHLGHETHAGKLPDVCRNRHGGNVNSEAANRAVHPSKSALKIKILAFVRERVGSTTEEIAEGLNLRYTTASGRISELRRDRELEDSGKTRPTSSGCAATVWTTKGTGTK